jgi:hypothetical protein
MPTATQITFGNDLGAGGAGNKKIDCLGVDTCEYITYKLTDDDDASNAACTAPPCDLRRVNSANSVDIGDPVVENVIPNEGDPYTPNDGDPSVPDDGLTFTYYESDGTTAESEDEIIKVLVRLEIVVSPGTRYEANQVLATEVDLRNR